MTGGKLYLANAFSLNMIPLEEGGCALIEAQRITLDEARRDVEAAAYTGRLECAIGHPGTARLAEELFDTIALACERKQIQLDPWDALIVLSLTFRPPEGKVYSYEELQHLMSEGKIALWRIRYMF